MRDKSLGAQISSQKWGIHTVTDTLYIHIRFATCENMLKGIVLSHVLNNYALPKLFRAPNAKPLTIFKVHVHCS